MNYYFFRHHESESEERFQAHTDAAQAIFHALAGFWSGDQITIGLCGGAQFSGEADTRECHDWIRGVIN